MAEQQMRGSGAVLICSYGIRTQVLDDTLATTFQHWYPGMGETPLAAEELMAA